METKHKLIKNMSGDCREMLADMAAASRETQAELIEKALKVYRVPALVQWAGLIEKYSTPKRSETFKVRGVPIELREIFKEAVRILGITQGRGFYLAALMLCEYSHNRARSESGGYGPCYHDARQRSNHPNLSDGK